MTSRVRRGFTLLETLVVVAIIGVILLFAMPFLYRMLQSYYVKTATNQIAIQIRMTRNLAVTQKVPYQIVFRSKDDFSAPNSYEIQYSPAGIFVEVPNIETNIPEAVNLLNTSIYSGNLATLVFDSRGRIMSANGTSPYNIELEGLFNISFRISVDSIGSVEITEV